jgi:ABC-type multidrug transport system ATPase subunit
MYQQELCKLSYLKYLLKIKLEFKYGLLSPSGCGKTTLLRYIVDRLQLNHGEITVLSVLSERPGSRDHQIPGRAVGFMLQETALYKDFSISEMLHCFGHLHNLNRQDILSREKFLLSFLDLPLRTRKIS